METETKTPNLLLQVGKTGEWFVVLGRSLGGAHNHNTTHLTTDDLRAVVQQAYDQFGILAAPSYDTEAERAPEPDPLQMIHDHVNKAHVQQAENRSGARALGVAAVHGVDL